MSRESGRVHRLRDEAATAGDIVQVNRPNLTQRHMLADMARCGDESPDEYADSVREQMVWLERDRRAWLLLHTRDDHRSDAVEHDAIGKAATKLRRMRRDARWDALSPGAVIDCDVCLDGYVGMRECPNCRGTALIRVD